MGDRETGDGVLPGFRLPKREGEKRGRKIGGKELGTSTSTGTILVLYEYSRCREYPGTRPRQEAPGHCVEYTPL